MASERIELFQGTLDLIVLQALSSMGPLHAYALASRLEAISKHPLTLNQGTLYASLVRLDQKGWIKGVWRRPRTIAKPSTTSSRKLEHARWRSKASAGTGSPIWSTALAPEKP